MAEEVTLRFSAEGIRRARRRMEQLRDKLEDIGVTGRRVRRVMRGLRAAVVAGTAALAAMAAGMGALARAAVGAGSELEQARIKLDSLFGSAEEGRAALTGLRDVARQLPFTFQEITTVAPTLAVISDSASQLRTRLAQAAEISARFGISLQETAGNMVRFFTAGAASADLFRERGVLQALGVVAGEQTTLEESKRLWRNFFQDIESSGSSALGRLADSFEGRLSMVQDAWFSLLASISESGLMDAVQAALTELQEIMEDILASGQAEDFAVAFTNALASMVGAIQGLVNVVVQVDDVIRESFLGRILGMERGPAGQLVEAQETLDELRELRDQPPPELGRLRARARDLGVLLPDEGMAPGAQRDLILESVRSSIEGLTNQIDAPGGLADQFSRSTGLLNTFNEALDRMQRALRGEGGAGGTGLTPPDLTGGVPAPVGGRRTGTPGLSTETVDAAAGDVTDLLAPGSREGLIDALRSMADESQQARDILREMGVSVESSFSTIADVSIRSMGTAVQAALTGFNNIANIVISAVTNIIQALSRSGGPLGGALGGFLGPIAGAAGAILGAVVSGGGDDRPQPVEIKNRDPIEVEEQRDRGPDSVILQILDSTTGEKVDEIEYELRRRERRDRTRRIPSGTNLRLAGA